MFTFIKYISPTWYFNLESLNYKRYWANFDNLSEKDRTLIEETDCYGSNEVYLLDIAYQAWIKGIIVEKENGLNITNIQPSLKDEYKFIRRHFNPIWGFFVLLIRLIELHNPLKEIQAYFSSLGTKRIDTYAKTKDWRPLLEAFDSKMLDQNPRVSIIIPTLNRYQYLKDVLEDLEKQDYKNFEVLVIDQSEPFQKDFYKSYNLDINVWYQEEKALWLARNTAIERSGAELILLFDDDSRVASDWIRTHIKCLDYFQADISSGVSISVAGAKVPQTYSYYKWGDQVDTGNVMVKKEVFRKVGLFDRQFEKQRQGDGEFGLRAYLAGYVNISNPDAMRLHLKVAEGGLRQMGSWDGWRPKGFLSPRPVPSVLYLTRKYFGNRAALFQITNSVLPSIIPYRFKKSRTMMILGSFLALIFLPLISIAVIKSWLSANQKLLEGAKITTLE